MSEIRQDEIKTVEIVKLCSYCGASAMKDENFCIRCGKALKKEEDTVYDSNSDFLIKNKDISAVTGKLIKLFKSKKIVISACCIAAVVLAAVIAGSNSVEKKLMKNEWWSDIEFENEYYDYSDSEGYWVTAECEVLLFYEYGTYKFEKYSMPGQGCAYLMSFIVNEDNCPSNFEWRRSGVNCDDYHTWTVLDGKRLCLGSNTYKWSSVASDDTWYLSRNKLRIGEKYYSTNEPDLNIADENPGLPSYWCAYCGEEGPFSVECPRCGKTEKAYS